MFKTIKVNVHFKVYGVRSLGLPDVLFYFTVFSSVPWLSLNNLHRAVADVFRY
jgi:hypothetical protein